MDTNNNPQNDAVAIDPALTVAPEGEAPLEAMEGEEAAPAPEVTEEEAAN